MKTSVSDPGSGAFFILDTGSGMDKKSGFGSGIENEDHISESIVTIPYLGKNT
jgi:hypothetical protein